MPTQALHPSSVWKYADATTGIAGKQTMTRERNLSKVSFESTVNPEDRKRSTNMTPMGTASNRFPIPKLKLAVTPCSDANCRP
jgi:hypothetical protein